MSTAQRELHEVKPGVAFFMPSHNEARNLSQVVNKVCVYFQGKNIPFSLIIVDDGSTDDTMVVLDELREQYPVEAAIHAVNRGYGAALRTGILESYERGHEFIVFCDSDGQFDPADVDLLLQKAAFNPEADAVIGYRHERADGFHRKVTGRLWHWLSGLVLDYDSRDVDCGFKLFRRSAIEAIDPTKLMGNHAVISPEILARMKARSLNVVEVSMPHYPREYGTQSGMKLSVMFKSIIGLFHVRKTIRKVTVDGNDYKNAEARLAA